MTVMSGQEATQIERVLRETERPMDPGHEDPTVPDPHSDRTRKFRTPNLSRMRTSWGADERILVEEMHAQARKLIDALFGDALDALDRLFLSVRQPEMNDDGFTMKLVNGRPVWKCYANGTPIEDWSNLGDRDRQNFLFEITTHLVDWEQKAASLWGEAMIAKVAFEGQFAEGYVDSHGKTVEDRTQAGTIFSIESRYFGVFRSIVSRKADALVRSMARLEQRLLVTTRV